MATHKLVIPVTLPDGADPEAFLAALTRRRISEHFEVLISDALYGRPGFGSWQEYAWVTEEDRESGEYQSNELDFWKPNYTLDALTIEPSE